jgi:hypothetical protein
METLQVNKIDALKMYQTADENGKTLLKELFGEQIDAKITDKVKTFDDACKVLNVNATELAVIFSSPILTSTILASDTASIKAYTKLILITRALNEGWEPDWDDDDEYKHYPWFYMQDSGFRLIDVDCHYTYSGVGSRLCFKSEELAQYAAKQFLDLYEVFMIL